MSKRKKKTRKLRKLYRLLNEVEQSHFPQWLSLELEMQTTQEQRKIILQIFDGLRRKLTDEEIIKNLWFEPQGTSRISDGLAKEKKFNAKLDRYYEKCGKWIEEYFAIKAFRRDTHTADSYFLRELAERKEENLFEASWKKVSKRLDEKGIRDSQYYHFKYDLASQYQAYLITFQPQKVNGSQQYLRESYFDKHWLLEKLRLASQSQRLDSIFDTQEEFQLRKEILATLITPKVLEKTPQIELYMMLLKASLGDFTIVDRFKELLEQNKYMLSEEEQAEMVQIISNFFIRKANNSGALSDWEQLLSLYEWQFDHEIVRINAQLYRNMIRICLRLSKMKDAEFKSLKLKQAADYLEKYKEKLPGAYRDEVYLYNKANYFFRTKRFTEVLQLQKEMISLNKEKRFRNIVYEIEYRFTAIQSRFENKDLFHLENDARSLLEYIKNQSKLSASQRKRWVVRAHFTLRLIRAVEASKGRQKKLQSLQKKIIEASPFNGEAWIIEKVREYLS